MQRVRVDYVNDALVKPIETPFLIPDRVPVDGRVRFPFLREDDVVAHFDLPLTTLRRPDTNTEVTRP
ncbi:MAG TPA: hypothetical protein VIU64_07920 [Polyangia bacterium]